MRPIKAIVIHHSVSPPDTTREDIDRWHKARGFSGIGYHYLIRRGEHPEVVRGRPDEQRGAHLKPIEDSWLWNSTSLAICIAGNYEESLIAEDMLTQAVEVAAEYCSRYGLTEADVYGHREVRATLCPGRFIDMELFREQVGSLLEQIR